MKIKIRTTHDFIELKVDEIETTIFNSSKQEIESLIENLEETLLELKKICTQNH